MKAVAAQFSIGRVEGLHAQGLEAGLHGGVAGQQTRHRKARTVLGDQRFEQAHHAAALGQQRLAGGVVGLQCRLHGQVGRQLRGVQFRITARQIDRVGGRQRGIAQGRKIDQLGAQRAQGVAVGGVAERVGRIVGNGNATPGQQGRHARHRRRLEMAEGYGRKIHGRTQGVCGRIDAGVDVGKLVGLHQPQMPFRQRHRGITRQGTQPVQRRPQAVGQHLGVARAADAVGDHAVKRLGQS